MVVPRARSATVRAIGLRERTKATWNTGLTAPMMTKPTKQVRARTNGGCRSICRRSQAQAASHQRKGWETFTDRIIECLSARDKACVFLLWGSYAQKKGAVIDPSKHRILQAPHPSPLSAHRSFFGCRHFSQCNEILESIGETPIDWRVNSGQGAA